MKVGVISNTDLCLPLLFFLVNNKVQVNLYLGNNSVIDPKRQDIHRFCSSYNLAFTEQATDSTSVYEWTNAVDPDFIFVLGHLKKIDCDKVKATRGIYNVHFGKLPEYRGASPVFWQMKKMESSLGLSIHALTDEMDAGPVYWTKEIRNEEHFTHNYVQYLFSNLMLEGINEILSRANDASFQPQVQDDSQARWHAKPSLHDVLIKWDQMNAEEICSLVRACNNWNVGAITLYEGMELKIVDAGNNPKISRGDFKPGTITRIEDAVMVSCADGTEIAIHYLSLNGIPIAGRHARKYGITELEQLTYPSD